MANCSQYRDSSPEIKEIQPHEVANSVPSTWKPVGSLAAQIVAKAVKGGDK